MSKEGGGAEEKHLCPKFAVVGAQPGETEREGAVRQRKKTRQNRGKRLKKKREEGRLKGGTDEKKVRLVRKRGRGLERGICESLFDCGLLEVG